MAMTKKTLSLKLMIDKEANKVLFGEANKEFVDFLFSIMILPVGTMIRLLTKQNMVGCLGQLYGSIEKLPDTYIQPNQTKDSILKPSSAAQFPVLLCTQPTTSSTRHYYRCCSNLTDIYNSCRNYVTQVPNTVCPACVRHFMSVEITDVSPSGTNGVAPTVEGKGYVHGVATYMVMDDLTVMPMSTISSISLLKQFNVDNVSSLQEMVVDLDMEKGLQLLKASLQSSTVLSDVFLPPMKEAAQATSTKKKTSTSKKRRRW